MANSPTIARYLQDLGYTPETAIKEAAKYSGHGGEAGMSASEAGVVARNKSLHVAQRHARQAYQLKRAPSRNKALRIRGTRPQTSPLLVR